MLRFPQGDGTAVQLYNKHGGYGNDIYDIVFAHTPTASDGTDIAEFSLGEAHRGISGTGNGVIKRNHYCYCTGQLITDVEFLSFWED